MTALTDQYLAALVKHDPAGLPLSRGVRFTENTAEIRIGDGLWVGASEAPSRSTPSIRRPIRWAFTGL
jgi:hypothetical protein